MVKLNASPDMRYGVRLSNGVSKMGPRREILTIAIEAAKVGVEVVTWTVPGKQKIDRLHRAELIHTEYRGELPVLRPND
jgi:hypothetical protein